MSILIKGMEMPQSCASCPLSEEEFVQCKITRKRFLKAVDAMSRRHPYCPLVEIPPHGRLIDADAFTKDECNYCDGACEALPCDCLNCTADCRCEFMQDITNAPTIIEAERELSQK